MRRLQRNSLFTLLALLCAATAWAQPTVLTMPDGIRAATTNTAYAWAGNPVYFWGRVVWDPAATSGTYVLDCGNGTTASGAVTNANDIGMSCTYASANTYHAKLTVTDSAGGVGSATTRIDVLTMVDKDAQINLAIERGLKHMYDRWVAIGSGGGIYESGSYVVGQTAGALLAFELRGHKPGLDAADRVAKEATEIYARLVDTGLDYVLAHLDRQNLSVQGAGNPDTNANGYGLYENDGRSPYTIGPIIMALVGAGDSDGNPATPDAGSIVATVGIPEVNGRTLHDIVQDMVDWCAMAQVEPNRGSYRGGWRYGANYSSSDNSASQWCAIGSDEAAVQWGVTIPQFMKDENALWTSTSQAGDGHCGYTGADNNGTNWTVTETASCIAQMSMQGVAQSDPKIQAAEAFLATNMGVHINGSAQQIYGMYAVTKAARAARDGAGHRKTIDLLNGTRDWYAEYSTKLIATQQADGHWNDTHWLGNSYFSTPWAVEILTPALTGQPPVADAGGPYATLPNQDVALDGCSSRHEDPAKFLTQYEWDIDNDGTFDIVRAAPNCTATVVGGYPETGSNYDQLIRLRVTDNVGDTDQDTAIVSVTSGNVAPTADPGGPYVGAVGASVTLDGSGSTDPNAGEPTGGTITTYEWDLDGNGSYETSSGASPTLSHTWGSAFSGSIGLRVTDDLGKSGTASTPAQIAVTNVQLVATDPYTVMKVTRLSRFIFEYKMKMTFTNVGTANAESVQAELLNFPSNVTVVDGVVGFGTIPAGGTVVSSDTFTIRVNRRIRTRDRDLGWHLTYTGPGGADAVDLTLPWL